MGFYGMYTLVNVYTAMVLITFFHGKTHELDWAMFTSKLLVITRGYLYRVAQMELPKYWAGLVHSRSPTILLNYQRVCV